jgi:hypothetical protein
MKKKSLSCEAGIFIFEILIKRFSEPSAQENAFSNVSKVLNFMFSRFSDFVFNSDVELREDNCSLQKYSNS